MDARTGVLEKRMFEEEMTELQSDMVDICNEYSCGVADKIFIYISYEGLLFPFHFYCIKNKLFHAGNLNESEATVNFDISTDCQRQVATIIKDDTRKIKSVCDKYNQPMPTEMRIVYEPKTKKFRSEYKYEKQFTDDMGLSDIVNAWFEEEKAKLADKGTDAPPAL